MHLTNYSWDPLKPCILLKWPNVTVLLDCALDFTSVYHFLPHTYHELSDLKKYSSFTPGNELKYLKVLRDNVYVQGNPEVHPTPLEALSMDSVDCILVSNWNSMVALPFYAYNTGFRGTIYATDPVLQFGKLMMEELIEHFDRVNRLDIDEKWKDPTVFGRLPNIPVRNPMEWRRFYTTKAMEEVVKKIVVVAFKQTVVLQGNIFITASNSGHHMGSCNWVVATEKDKIAYVSSSSARSTHTKMVEWDKLRDADTLIMTSLSPIPDNDPKSSMLAVRDVVIDTLKKGGNVLLPVTPVGGIYELIDIISNCIDTTTGISLETPIYFISPAAKRSIAFSNINAEWLSEERQNCVYVPEEPFGHAQLLRSGRLKVYETLYDDFSREYKSPCVIFCGHPSLRVGDAAHILEMWGSDNRNALIMTNADFPLQSTYSPFEGLSIRAYYYPVDTRLDFNQLNTSILPDLKPKSMYVPEEYMTPMMPGRQDLCVQFVSCTPMRYDETLLLSAKRVRKRKIKLHADIIKKLDAKPHPATDEFGICPLSGMLSVYDEAFELLPIKKRVGAFRPRYTGRLTPEMIAKALQKRNLMVRPVLNEDGSTRIHVDSLASSIQLTSDGLKTTIQAPTEHRAMLIDAVTSYLSMLC